MCLFRIPLTNLRLFNKQFARAAYLSGALTRVGEFTTHPAAFAVVAAYALAWLMLSPQTFGWAAIATLATWLITLFINRTEHRDTQAIHACTDGAISRMRNRNELIPPRSPL